MSTIKLINVKSNVVMNGLTIIIKGLYKEDSLLGAFPLIDFSNSTYFQKYEKEPLLPGTRVRYMKQNYFIMSLNDSGDKDYYGNIRPISIGQINKKGEVEFKYILTNNLSDTTSRNPNKKNFKYVSEDGLEKVKSYWFISSKGAFQQAIYGDDLRADEWRELNNNIFKTIEDARNKYANIIELSKLK